jgi:hypothetical protein
MYKKTDETLGIDAATYVYHHSNICNISIDFCNIHMKQLKHTSETTETLETWARNMSEKHPETLENISSPYGHVLPGRQL